MMPALQECVVIISILMKNGTTQHHRTHTSENHTPSSTSVCVLLEQRGLTVDVYLNQAVGVVDGGFSLYCMQ